jgi:hypothetical protein
LRKYNDLDKIVDFFRSGEGRRKHLELHDILLHLCVQDLNIIHGAFGIPDRILYTQVYDELFVNALMKYEDGKKLV